MVKPTWGDANSTLQENQNVGFAVRSQSIETSRRAARV
jgi:hypothetical protein